MFDADTHWNHLPTRVKPDLKDFLSTLVRSKADSTVENYKNEIVKFIEWYNLSNVRPVPPLLSSREGYVRLRDRLHGPGWPG